jgi:hypothetical protein
MTQRVSFYPAMCRFNMLPDDLMAEMNNLFSLASDHSLTAITVPIFYDGECTHILAGLRFMIGTKDNKTITQTGFPPALDARARDLAIEMTKDQMLASYIDTMDASYLVFQSKGTYCLTFFPDCAIVAPDDPAARMISDSYELSKHPEKVGNRAQVCAIALNEVTSSHQRAAQPPEVLEALGQWRLMTGVYSPSVEHEAGLRLESPLQADIMACNNESIEE